MRRWDAMPEGQLSDAQRASLARAKRKDGAPPAPPAKRGDRKPWGFHTGRFDSLINENLKGAETKRANIPPAYWKWRWEKHGGKGRDQMWAALRARDDDDARKIMWEKHGRKGRDQTMWAALKYDARES